MSKTHSNKKFNNSIHKINKDFNTNAAGKSKSKSKSKYDYGPPQPPSPLPLYTTSHNSNLEYKPKNFYPRFPTPQEIDKPKFDFDDFFTKQKLEKSNTTVPKLVPKPVPKPVPKHVHKPVPKPVPKLVHKSTLKYMDDGPIMTLPENKKGKSILKNNYLASNN